MQQIHFRIKDTKFRVITRRDKSFLLYSGSAQGSEKFRHWNFLGHFQTALGKNGYRAAARKAAKPRAILASRNVRQGKTLSNVETRFSGALSGMTTKGFQ